MNYYLQQNEKIVLFDTDKERLSNTLVCIPQYGDLEILETEREIIELNNEFVFKDEVEEELKQREKERIAKLTCTKRVFALMLKELGISYTMLKELIATNEQAQLEWDLSVQLERGNPLLDVMAMQLGITSEQLDGLFRYANGEITIEQFRELIPEPDVDNPEEPVEENPVDTELESDEV